MEQRLLTAKEVSSITTLSRSAVDRMVNAGQFPIPVRIGKRRYAWVESEVRQWVTDQIENRI